MKRNLLLSFGLIVALSAGFIALDAKTGASDGDIVVDQVHANLVRVRINGHWEEFPLMPLANHLCHGPARYFEKYCPDEVLAPEPEPSPASDHPVR